MKTPIEKLRRKVGKNEKKSTVAGYANALQDQPATGVNQLADPAATADRKLPINQGTPPAIVSAASPGFAKGGVIPTRRSGHAGLDALDGFAPKKPKTPVAGVPHLAKKAKPR